MGNIALNKPVICTGTPFETYIQSNITDGNTSTGYLAYLDTSFKATINLQSEYKCKSITIYSIYYSSTLRTKDFTVSISHNGFETVIGSYLMTTSTHPMTIDLKDIVADTIIISVNSNYQGSSGTSSGLGEVIVDGEPVINHVSSKNASFTYQLPMNATQNILAKTNDPRVGLLGMANDAENYGDLYVVGSDGKSHLTRSGIKSEVIFEGLIKGLGKNNFSTSVKKFKQLVFETQNAVNGKRTGYNTIVMDNTAFVNQEIILYEWGERYFCFEFIDDIQFNVSMINNLYLKRVIGFY